MRYARIENGKVVEIGDFDGIEGRFHPSLFWVPCAIEVQVKWTYDGTNFAAPIVDLNVLKAAQIVLLSNSCKAEILSGFISTALGAAHLYDGTMEWQLNLAGAKDYAVANNVNVDFTCTELAIGVKAAVAHTPAQIQQVFNDGVVFKMARLSKFRLLKAQVDAAATLADVNAVVW